MGARNCRGAIARLIAGQKDPKLEHRAQHQFRYGHHEFSEKQIQVRQRGLGENFPFSISYLCNVVWGYRFSWLADPLDEPVVFQVGKVLLVYCEYPVHERLNRALYCDLLMVLEQNHQQFVAQWYTILPASYFAYSLNSA